MAGAEVVDQVITDSAGDCKKARRLLKEKYGGKICVSACAAHTLDLLLEDIGKLKRFARTIATMRVMGKVIMNHAAIRHEYKDKNGGKELDRYCDTRFGTRVTSQPVSIGSAERCWKAYANIHCAKRNRLGPGRAAKLTCVHYNMRLRHAREDPTFEPECLPPMELDPIDAEADDFDESE